MNITFSGLHDTHLEPYQIVNLQKLAEQEAGKLEHGVHNGNLVLHVKEYSKDGKKHKYSITMKLEYPGQLITSTQEDWDVVTAVRKTFNNAKNAVNKKFRK
ncbi:MAG: hypothetical protein CMH61_02310 [Nanoarchaeota archaeon]|nr:hypothetical protein [Nanoarchaeota archaeon]|tara:strand:+ start:871 stop:1173 length:303 start_codon:yes stop_codon:yes gene_type:complete